MEKDKYARPEYHPIDAAYQLTVELIQSGLLSKHNIDAGDYA